MNWEAIRATLSDPDPESRIAALDALVEQSAAGPQEPEVVEILLLGLYDSEWRVRKTAIEGLLLCDPAAVQEGLFAALGAEEHAGARNAAIETFIRMGRRAVDPILQRWGETAGDLKKFLIDILGEIGDPQAVLPLIEALGDPDLNVSAAAVEGLGRLGDGRAVEPLIRVLQLGDLWLQYPAAGALGRLGDSRAVGPLLRVLKERTLREAALEALGALGALEAVPTMVEALLDPQPTYRDVGLQGIDAIAVRPEGRARILEELRRYPVDHLVGSLLGVLEHPVLPVRRAAIRLLGWMRATMAVSLLVDQLEQEEEIRPAVVEALQELAGGTAATLLPYLQDDREKVRQGICQAMGEIRDLRAVPALVPMMTDENGHVRQKAAEALGRIGDPLAVPALLPLLGDPYIDVQEAAIEALGRLISSHRAAIAIGPLLQEPRPRLRRNCALLLGRVGGEGVLEPLTQALKDEAVEVRRAAALALRQVGGAQVLPLLLKALADEDAEIRATAALALGETRDARAIEPLCTLLGDQDSWVQTTAARSLGLLGRREAVPTLLQLLEREEGALAIYAIEAVGRIGDPRSRGPLSAFLAHRDPELRKAALRAYSLLAGGADPRILELLGDAHWSVRQAAVEALSVKASDPVVREALKRFLAAEEDPIVRQAALRALSGEGEDVEA